MATAVFAGLATLDIAYAVPSYPAEDSKTQATGQFLGAGGPAANAAVTYAHLSGRTPALVTALGAHPLARLIRDDLTSCGVTPHDVTPSGTHSPPVSSIVVATGAATRTIVSMDGAEISARFDPTRLGALDRARILLVDGHHPELAVGFAAAAHRAGIPVVLDAGRWRPVHPDLLPLTTVAICSAAFAPPGTGGDPDAVFDHLRRRGVRYAAISRGAAPMPFRAPDGAGRLVMPQVDAMDTLGAGDILHGAFCHYFVAGQQFPEALRSAATVASASCRYLGTREWMRHRIPQPR
ncbi:PfkB family carbohydrate kinase [Nocardia aurantia]|uniref:Sulfofructose kinase n=1 Tax=Nocardia aurantia TaxID=2585199 RepID=A0A7K0DG26_9NOCA|nr:PfkB family carbohydrate kinase [Nocardia aurantia]MQY24491.1 Sulfofructose kinase [Nocardia aurantia]